jgi:hypothetical protein
MIALTLFLDAEGMMADTDRGKVIVAEKDIKLGVLPGGMTSGMPSISMAIPLEDGRVVLAETSYRLFMMAAEAFATRYGWPNGFPAQRPSDAEPKGPVN